MMKAIMFALAASVVPARVTGDTPSLELDFSGTRATCKNSAREIKNQEIATAKREAKADFEDNKEICEREADLNAALANFETCEADLADALENPNCTPCNAVLDAGNIPPGFLDGLGDLRPGFLRGLRLFLNNNFLGLVEVGE